MAGSKSRVSEEKLLNEMFVLLEYSNSFAEFVESMSNEALEMLHDAIHHAVRAFDD